MFRWLRKLRPRRRPYPQRIILGLENLESRDCPTGSGAPSLTSFMVTDLGGHMVAFSGTVTDDSPATALVNITTPTQSTVTASVNADGTFYATDNSGALGTFDAQAQDEENLVSQIASCTLAVGAPLVTLTGVSHGANQEVTVTGVVSAAFPAETTVTLSGVVQGQAAVNSDGTFSYTGVATGLGTVSATASDIWGQYSNTAEVAVTVSAPAVSLDSVSCAGNQQVTVTGYVSGDLVTGVSLTGVVQGQAAVNSDGSFSYTGTASALGTISANATDVWGQTSMTAEIALTAAAPSVSIAGVTQSEGQQVTVTGYVSGDLSSVSAVILSGVVQGQATIDSDGSFSFTGIALGAGTIQATAIDSWGQTADPYSANFTNAAPVIDDFEAVAVDGDTYEIRGHVSDERAAGLTVTLAGFSSQGGNGAQVNVDENGNFSYQVNVAEQVFDTITANVTDSWGAAAQEASLPLQTFLTTTSAITITSITQGANRLVTVSGTVTGENVNDLTVTLTGVVTGSTTTDAAGNFTFSGVATAAGAIDITTTDAEEHTSEPVTAMLTNVDPVINIVQVLTVEQGQTYVVCGTVADEWSAGLTVMLTGLPVFGTGVAVTVDENGLFTCQFTVSRDASGAIVDVGTLTASVSDWFGAAAETTFRFLP